MVAAGHVVLVHHRVQAQRIALAGALTPKVWTDKQGNTRPALDMVATQVLTAYHAARKQQTLAEQGKDAR